VLLENGIWPIAWSNHGWGVLFAQGSTVHRERMWSACDEAP